MIKIIVQENNSLIIKQKNNIFNQAKRNNYEIANDYLNSEYDISTPNDLDQLLRLKNKLQIELENKIKKEKQILERQEINTEQAQQFDTAEEAIKARMNLSDQ